MPFRRRPGPLEDAGRRVTELLEATSFHRGLALGAFIGAAIAGSTLWARLREAQRAAADHASAESPSQEALTQESPTDHRPV